MFFRLKLKRTRKRARTSALRRVHFTTHQETARALVLERLEYFNRQYQFTWNRVAIRDQSSRWGSCSSKGNLNFNYRIVFLPEDMRDYIIVHELCHLSELNHGATFWQLVERAVPDARLMNAKVRKMRITTTGDLRT